MATKKPKFSVFMIATFVVITIYYILMYHVGLREQLLQLVLFQNNANNYNWLTQEGQLYKYITHSFLHASFIHYFMNELNFLLLYSALRREKVNEPIIIAVYCASVILGGFCHLLFNSGNINPTVLIGASGGIFGLIGLITVLYYKNGEYYLLRLTFLIDLPMNIIISLMVPSISWIAHLTGFVIGVSVGIIAIQKKHQLKRKQV